MKQHLGPARTVAAGLRVLPHSASAWAAAQGAWRFYQNPRVSLPQLAEPLLAQGRKAVADECAAYALVVHDWSPLGYKRHGSKRDRIAVSHADDLGYELQTALVVSDQNGAPLAPIYLGVRAAQGVYSSRRERPLPARPHLAELSRTLNYVARVGLAKPAVHIVDREADAVRHLRRWHRRGHYVLIRAQSRRLVRYQGQEQRLSSVVAQLQASLSFSRAVEYKGQQATQYVTEAEVTLHRVAKVRRPHTQGREREHIAGPRLPLRLIVSEVRSPEGVVLTQWWLWTNLPA